MAHATDLQTNFNSLVTADGQQVRIRCFTQTYSGTAYDESYVTKSGNDYWCMGLHLPMGKLSGEDFKFVQQGMIKQEDSVLYLAGSVVINNQQKYKLWIGGSPSVSTPYEMTEMGVQNWSVSGTDIYQKLWVRRLNGGSFANEY